MPGACRVEAAKRARRHRPARLTLGRQLAIILLGAVVWSAGSAAQDAAAEGDPAAGASPAATAPHVTNLWVDTELTEVLRDISAQTGVTIIPDQSVQGTISLSAKDMPLTECLERVCAVAGYGYARVKDYYVVGRPEPGTPLFRKVADFQRVKLRHASTEQLKAMLPQTLARHVTYDSDNGIALVCAPSEIQQRVLDAIKLIDTPNLQIAVDAIVFELTEDGSKQLGLDWQYQNAETSVGVENLVGTVTYNAASDMATYVDVTLRAIVQEQKGQVLANPRILAMNGRLAEIFVGQEEYFSLLSGSANNPYYRLESIKTGVTLKVTPHIGEGGNIVLDLEPEVSDVVTDWARERNESRENGTVSSLPIVTRRRAKTSVAIHDCQTVVIGGLLREQKISMVEKVPFLGDLPVLGMAFRKVRESKAQREVAILITTHLIRDGSDQGAAGAPTTLQQHYVSPLDAIDIVPIGEKQCSSQ